MGQPAGCSARAGAGSISRPPSTPTHASASGNGGAQPSLGEQVAAVKPFGPAPITKASCFSTYRTEMEPARGHEKAGLCGSPAARPLARSH